MAEELESLCQHLSLSEKESCEIHVDSTVLEPNIARGERCLLMTLLTDRYYNREALKSMMKKVWQPIHKVSFKELGSKLILVEFADDHDKQRVLREGPCSFDRNLVLMKCLEGDRQVTKIRLSEASFWIRMYEMPLNAMNEEVGRIIGNKIGFVEEVDEEQGEAAWGEFMRIRVRMDISQPLMRGVRVKLGQYGICWIRFAYERLPNFCYWCGKLGHQFKDCEGVGHQEIRASANLPFGAWLLAGSLMGSGEKNVGIQTFVHRNSSPEAPLESEK
ncbi:uncharacterized protein LOC122289219 [Carya illinoinensis]|uniref:uncharacterized protein LOC122289219 n=1 Tax=Carya illinoinensis TaxID=32201 RepID=UPI001C71DC4D|nr:uncharacterized protein LOC122289219 [Carya illinoinensis]